MATVPTPNIRIAGKFGSSGPDFSHLLSFHLADFRSKVLCEESQASDEKKNCPDRAPASPFLPTGAGMSSFDSKSLLDGVPPIPTLALPDASQLPNLKAPSWWPPQLPSFHAPGMPSLQSSELPKVPSLSELKTQLVQGMEKPKAEIVEKMQVNHADFVQVVQGMEEPRHEVTEGYQPLRPDIFIRGAQQALVAAGEQLKLLGGKMQEVFELLPLVGEAEETGSSCANEHAKRCKQLLEQGWELERGCDPVGAITKFEELSKLEPSAPNLVRYSKNLSDLCYLPELGKKVQMDAFKKAVAASAAAVETDPTHVDSHIAHCISQGRLAIISDNRTKVQLAKSASDAAELALKVDPNSDFAWHLMGRWHYEMAGINPIVRSLIGYVFGAALMPGTYPEALRHYKMAVQLNPNEVLHHVGLGQALLKVGDFPAAGKAFETSTKMEIYDINAKYLVEEARDILKKLRKSKAASRLWDLDGSGSDRDSSKPLEAGIGCKSDAAATQGPEAVAANTAVNEAGRLVVGPAAVSAEDAAKVAVDAAVMKAVGVVSMQEGTEPGANPVEKATPDQGGPQAAHLFSKMIQVWSIASRSLAQRPWGLPKLPYPGFPQLGTVAAVAEDDWLSEKVGSSGGRPSRSEIGHQTTKGLKFQEAMNPEAAADVFEGLARQLPSSETLAHLSKNLSDMSYLPHLSASKRRHLNHRALKTAEVAVGADPTNAHAHLSLSLSQERLARFSDLPKKVKLLQAAYESAQDALEMDPHNDLAHHTLGRLHYELAGVPPPVRSIAGFLSGARVLSGSYDEALNMFKTAAKLSPSRLIHRAELGRTLVKVGDVQGAISHLEHCQSLDVEDISDLRVKEDSAKLLHELKRKQGILSPKSA